MKLTRKLTLAFLLISLVAIGLAALFIWINTATRFSQYMVDQRQTEFVAITRQYYITHGHWNGVDTTLRESGLLPPIAAPGTNQPDPQPFVLVDQNRLVIIAGGDYQPGQKVKQGILDRGIGIEVGGVVVGTVVATGGVPAPNAIEQKYIDGVNRALLVAALGGAAIALVLGLVIARSLSRPLRDLNKATRLIAQGKLDQPVPVRSADEFGELAAAFNQMSTDLHKANQSRRQMTADIAHDLRNPLTVLSGYLESLEDGKLPPTQERFATMQAEVRHLQHLVEDLRTLSLADSGELQLQFKPAAPGELLRRVEMAYQHQARQQDIALVVKVEPGLPEVSLDMERMEQVLGNLVSNALRFTPPGGKILLAAESQKDQVFLVVEDTGSGIPVEILPKIFERSYRGDPARGGDQSGLGLAIARSLVELHGGQIEAFSGGLNQGSTFKISLPRQG